MLQTQEKKATQQTGAEAPSPGKTDGAAFSVSISKTAGNLIKATELAKAPSNEDEIRMDKVNAIREQLAAGTYSISGKDVAIKILNSLKG